MNGRNGRAVAFTPLIVFWVARHLRVFGPFRGSGHQSRTLLHQIFPVAAVLGTMTATLAALLTLAASNGIDAALRAKLAGLDSHILVASTDNGGIPDYEQLIRRIKQVDGVMAIAPFLRDAGSQLTIGDEDPYPILLKGIEADEERAATNIADSLVEGRLDPLSSIGRPDRPIPLILGHSTAKDLNVSVGDRFSIVHPGAMSTRTFLAELVGVFRTDTSYDRTLGYLPLRDAQEMQGPRRTSVTGLAIKTVDVYRSAETAARIQRLLGDQFAVSDWKSIRPELFSLVQLIRKLIFVWEALIFLVGVLLVLAVLSAILSQQRKDIVMLITLGMRPRLVQLTIAASGTAVGGLGIVAGAILGQPLSHYLTVHRILSLPEASALITYVPFQLMQVQVVAIALGEFLVLFVSA